MSFGSHDQENLLSILAFDDTPGGCVVAAQMLPADAWDTYYGKIYKKLAAFIERFGGAACDNTYDIIERLCAAEPDSAEAYRKIYRSMVESWGGGLNREYVYDCAVTHGRHARLRKGIGEALGYLSKTTPEACAKAERALEQAKHSNAEVMTIGMSTHDAEGMAKAATTRPDKPFHTGIVELDEVDAGPARKELTLIAGKYGSGKSFGLSDIGLAANLIDRARVLIITLEMSEAKVMRRLAQRMFGYAASAGVVPYTRFLQDAKGSLLDFQPDELTVKGLYEEYAYDDILEQARGLSYRPEIIVKGFKSGSLTMDQLYAYIDFLYGKMGWLPDVIVLDYLQIMKILSAATKRAELGQYAVDLRGLAQHYNVALASAIQLNRDGMKHAMARGDNLSEDISAAHTADRLLIYNQSETEKKMGIARLWVDKSRDGNDGFEVLISQAYAAGVYRLDSMRMHSTYDEVMKRIEGMSEAA